MIPRVCHMTSWFRAPTSLQAEIIPWNASWTQSSKSTSEYLPHQLRLHINHSTYLHLSLTPFTPLLSPAAEGWNSPRIQQKPSKSDTKGGVCTSRRNQPGILPNCNLKNCRFSFVQSPCEVFLTSDMVMSDLSSTKLYHIVGKIPRVVDFQRVGTLLLPPSKC